MKVSRTQLMDWSATIYESSIVENWLDNNNVPDAVGAEEKLWNEVVAQPLLETLGKLLETYRSAPRGKDVPSKPPNLRSNSVLRVGGCQSRG